MLRKEHQDHSEKKTADNEEFEIGSDFVDCDLDAAYGIWLEDKYEMYILYDWVKYE